MAKNLLNNNKTRDPFTMRKAVKPVDMFSEATKEQKKNDNKTERSNRTVEPNANTEVSNRGVTPNKSTDELHRSLTPNADTVQPNELNEETLNNIGETIKGDMGATSILIELEQDDDSIKRVRERYSFEIYKDQKMLLEEASFLYKKSTGKKLSASRVIREGLDIYLNELLKKLRNSVK